MEHDQEEMAEKKDLRKNILSCFRRGRRLALTRVLIVSFALIGVITLGLPKPNLEAVERVRVGDSEDGSDLLVLSIKEMEQDWGDSNEAFEEGVEKNSEKEGSFRYEATTTGRPLTVRDKDLAKIALDHFGGLDIETLKTLQEKNPQVQDWNRLDETVQVMLPEVPQATKRGADFYTIQVGAFKSEEGASRQASDLAKRGAQNVFLIKGGGKKLSLVCVGVFESRQQTSGSIRSIQKWGLGDAFPTRIEEKHLEEILQPCSGSISDKPKQ